MKWLFLLGLFALASCAGSKKLNSSETPDGFVTTSTGLKYKILQE
jgi:hypothetical protein